MATATKAPPAKRRKVAPPDVAKFKALKGRVIDFYANCQDVIREQKTLTMTATLYAEMAWLAAEARRLVGDELEGVLGAEYARFAQVERYVERVCDEQAEAVKTGAFVKENAAIFAAVRFLVRSLESVLKYVLDVEDQFALGGTLPDRHKARITLDIGEVMGADLADLVAAGDLE